MMSCSRLTRSKSLSVLLLFVVLAPFTLGTTEVPIGLRFAVEGTILRPVGASGNVFIALVGRGGGCESENYAPLTYGPWGGQGDSDPFVSPSSTIDDPNKFYVSATSWCKPDFIAVAVSAPDHVMVLSEPIGVGVLERDSVFAETLHRNEPAGCGYYRDGGTMRYLATIERQPSQPVVVRVPY